MTNDRRIKKFNEFGFDEAVTSALERIGYFTAPASAKYHGNYEGGLFDHSLAVTNILLDFTEKLNLKWTSKHSPIVIGMFHDLCKCNLYEWDIETESYKYNNDLIIPGHAEKSIIIAQNLIQLTEEEIACIRWHMGAYETDPKMWDYYGRAIERYPNVLYTHTADMVASKIMKV